MPERGDHHGRGNLRDRSAQVHRVRGPFRPAAVRRGLPGGLHSRGARAAGRPLHGCRWFGPRSLQPASPETMETRAAQALGAQCNCRITMQRSETRAQTPIPDLQAHRSKPAGAFKFLEKIATSAYSVSASSYQKYSFKRALPAAAVWAWAAWWCESAALPCPYRPPAMPARP